MIGSFVGISSLAKLEPVITILGGIYLSQESDSYFGALRIFDRYVKIKSNIVSVFYEFYYLQFYILWTLSTLIVSFIMSIEVLRNENSLGIFDIYMREIRLLIETTFFQCIE
jgi:hypothetical protein